MSVDKSRLSELQGALRQKMADNKEIADSFKMEEGVMQVTAEQKTAFDKNMSDIKEIKSLIEGLESMDEVSRWSEAPAADSVAMKADAQAFASEVADAVRKGASARSLGELFIQSEEFKSLKGGANGANMPSPWQLKTSDFTGYNVKDVYSALPSGTPGSFGAIQRDPIVDQPTRTRRVRDLFPARTTTAAVIEYFRMIGFTTPGTSAVNAASSVAERNGSDFHLKPQSSMQFIGEQAPVRTLAHWEAAHRNVLADEPQLRSIIDNELMYGLRLEEDDQLLNGDGTGENLTGILQTSDVQTYSWSDGNYDASNAALTDKRVDAIRRAATLSFLSYYEPTGVVMHPNDWEEIELSKDANGQYLVAVSVAMGGEPRIWRIPVIETPAIAEGTALVGAFGTGAQLYDREQASIRISEQHSDFFVRNAIVVLAEQRLALAVKRPEAFVKVSFDAAPTS
jgi:HK97 family phage major capsid protein